MIAECQKISPGSEWRFVQASDLALPGNDFWVIDDHTVLFNHFTGDGDWAAEPFELRTEPAVIKLCATAFDSAWERAVDHADYRP